MSSHRAGTRAQSQVVYAAALVQGIVLVTFPAASTIFTSASQLGVGPLRRAGLTLPGLYGVSALVAVALGYSRWPLPTAARRPGPCTPGRSHGRHHSPLRN
jgi:hypothetical protein